MAKKQTKRGLIIGVMAFIFLVLAGGAAFWLFNKNTDNRSQAAAAPVAAIKVVSQKDRTGVISQTVVVDISQMKAGTTVTGFSGQIFVPSKGMSIPEERQPTKGPVPISPTKGPIAPTKLPYPQAATITPPPHARVVTSAPSNANSGNAVLGVTTDNRVSQPIQESPEKAPGTILAQSKDGYLSIGGVGQFSRLQNLKVTVETQPTGYLISLVGQASVKDLDIQQSFIKAQPLFAILPVEKKVAMGTPEVRMAIVEGYLPGMKTIVDLTKLVPPTATSMPEKPAPGSCRKNEDCPRGYVCSQPPMPPCPKGKACPQVMPALKCVPAPTVNKFPTKTPPLNVTARPSFMIKTVR